MQYRGGNKLAHLLPRSDLGAIPDSRGVEHAGSLGRDERRLGDEERTGDGGPLLIVLDDEVGWDVLTAGSVAGEGCKDDTMPELHVAYLDGGEEGRGGGGHSCKLASTTK